MTKDILKDKFYIAILLPLIFTLISIKKTDDWLVLLILFLIMMVILSIIFYLRNDLYIQSFSANSELIIIEFQKNFSKNKIKKITIPPKLIKSIDFNSKSFLEPFHIITIKFKDENGLYDKKSFKTNNDEIFIKLLFKLKVEKNKNNNV